MATSPNYGWTEPDNTSLVKDGAQAMRTLGDAIDTSVWNVGFGQAGKNKIINGDFGIWQRGTTFTNPSSGTYTADRWTVQGGSVPSASSITRQTFTAGTAPVAGYEGQYFLRNTITTSTGADWALLQKIEDVRTLAGRTFTISFWAKADSNRSMTVDALQYFGASGSSPVGITGIAVNLTTAWQRFSVTLAFPSISGKTVDAGSFTNVYFKQTMANGSILDLWGVQVEYGSKASPFQTASGGSPQAELAMCQRYYVRYGGTAAYEKVAGIGTAYATTGLYFVNQFPVTMRVAPTSIEYATMQVSDIVNTALPVTSLTLSNAGKLGTGLLAGVASGAVQYRPYDLTTANSTNGYVAFSAEL